MRHYNRSYASTDEYARRMRVFGENLKHARNFQRMERGSAQYGVTKFSDMTGEAAAGPETRRRDGWTGSGGRPGQGTVPGAFVIV